MSYLLVKLRKKEMEYTKGRENIKSGDLLAWSKKDFTTIKDLFPWIVRVFTASKYTHVGVAWVVEGRVFVIEAVPPCVRIYPLSRRLPCYHINMNVDWQEGDDKFLIDQVGKPYSTMDAIRGYLYEPNSENDRWMCVKLSKFFYDIVEVDVGDSWTPAGLVEYLVTTKDKKINYLS